jgi:hypothetical protein
MWRPQTTTPRLRDFPSDEDNLLEVRVFGVTGINSITIPASRWDGSNGTNGRGAGCHRSWLHRMLRGERKVFRGH